MRNISKIMSNRYRIYIRGKNSGGKVRTLVFTRKWHERICW